MITTNHNKTFGELLWHFRHCRASSTSLRPHEIKSVIQIQTHISLQDALNLLRCCPSLQKLSLITVQNDQTNKNRLEELLAYPSLKYIGLRSATVLDGLNHKEKIKCLYVDQNQQISAKFLQQFQSLEKLTLFGKPNAKFLIKSDLQFGLNYLKQLKELCLRYYNVNNQTFLVLYQTLPKLTQLALYYCVYNQTSDDLILPNLKEIQISINFETKDSILHLLKQIAKKQIQLQFQFVTFQLKYQYQQLFLNELTKPNFTLKNLDLYCSESEAIYDILKSTHKSLEQFKVCASQNLNTKIIKELVFRHKQLQHLELFNCKSIDNECLIEISRLVNLKYLDLNICNFDNRGLIYLKKLTNLEILSVFNNRILQKDFILLLCNLKKVWKSRVFHGYGFNKHYKKVSENICQLRYYI